MCGIAGILEHRNSGSIAQREEIARAMAASLRHRGPDDGGVWSDSVVTLAHRRLSIIDLSPEGHQPMRSPCGRLTVAFNGEIYNFPELRRVLEGRGHKFRGGSDTEVLLAAVLEWGLEDALRRARGMFAIALWDATRRELSLARDRLGEKPLYYARDGARVAFASELRALAVHPSVPRELDPEALALYFRQLCVPAPYAILRGTRKLLPGTICRIRAGEPGSWSETAYWSLRDVVVAGAESPFHGSIDDAADALEATLGEAVRLQSVSDVPLGAFLSGGVDSSTIVALAQSGASEPVKTFSIGVDDPQHDESEFARNVARHLGTDHTEFRVSSSEALAVVPDLASIYDEPFADSSQIPTVLVSRCARRAVTVVLSGDGGDELFGGYQRYDAAAHIWRRLALVPSAGRRSIAAGLSRVDGATWDRWLAPLGRALPRTSARANGESIGKLVRVLEARTFDDLYFHLTSQWKDPQVVAPFARDVAAYSRTDGIGHPDLRARAMYADLMAYLPNDLLVKVDRAAMSTSLETRVPLLDPEVVALAWRFPLAQRIGPAGTKAVLRRVLYRHVPRVLIDRPKRGFTVPINRWLHGPLRDWAEPLLDERRLRAEGVLDAQAVRAAWAAIGRQQHSTSHLVWTVLMFQAWMERALPPASRLAA